jgi:ATP-binding cassette subfamily F protein uup
MAPPLLNLAGTALSYGAKTLFDGVDVAVSRGERIALVGRNGSGKSTLMKVMAGLVDPDRGTRFVQPGTRIAYLPQEPDFGAARTVAEFVAADGAPSWRVDAMVERVGLIADTPVSGLSGGEARRAALARALVGEPDILLMDEPTNHLGIAAIEWLEAELAQFRGGLVLVSHDRAFLGHLTSTVFWLDRGIVRRHDQGFATFEAWSEEVLAQEEAERARLDKRIAAETVWLRQGVTARRRRNQGRLRRLGELRAERARQISVAGRPPLEADVGATSGKLVVEAEAIAKSWGDRPIVRGFSTRILRGDRIGIIGPNGAGKTTLLRLLTGDLAPDQGRVRLGTNLQPVYLDQRRASLDPERTLWATLTGGSGDQVMVRGTPRHVVGYLKDFLFDEGQALAPVGSLSGGERNRLTLALALARPSNFLILDEPTNDLDMDTLDLLEEMLADYEGTLLLVSHDRDFLDRLVTSTIALEGDGKVAEYVGGYTDYLRQRPPPPAPVAQKAAPKAEAPARAPSKLSSKEVRELDQLAKRMEALATEIAGLEAKLADAGLFARDPAAFQKTADRLAAAGAERHAAEERWLELELKREELAGRG